MKTSDLIATLAGNLKPVRRLRPPVVRAAGWLLLAALVLALLAISQGIRPDLAQRLHDRTFTVSIVASLLTGVLAAIAAFQISLPDRSRRWLLLPLPALVVPSCASATAILPPEPSLPTQPVLPANGPLVYDLARKFVVLVTPGASQQAGRLQTWTWDGRTWTRRMPTTSPTTRDGALLAYDSSRHMTFLYCGLNHGYLTASWEWNGSN